MENDEEINQNMPLQPIDQKSLNDNKSPNIHRIYHLKRFNKLLKFLIFIFIIIIIILIICGFIAGIYIRKIYIKQFNCQNKTINNNAFIPIVSNITEINNNTKTISFINDYKIPNYYVPYFYNLTFFIENMDENKGLDYYKNVSSKPFYGHAKLFFNITKQIDKVILHYADMKIMKFSLYQTKQNYKFINITYLINKTYYDKQLNFWFIYLNTNLTINSNYIIDVYYEGQITVNISGLIETFAIDIINKKTYSNYYTKLEPIGCRRLLPCFDEPNKKIKVVIKILHEHTKLCLSNTPIKSSQSISDIKTLFPMLTYNNDIKQLILTSFYETPVYMAPYLIAFVIVDNYTWTEIERKPNYKIRIIYPKYINYPINDSLQLAKRAENEMEVYFNLTNPFKKSDHIFIPNFIAGAMENWGLMSYKLYKLLVDDSMDFFRKNPYLETLIHELAHIWFGNWITTDWWHEIWINEGFATYFSSYFYYKLSNNPINIKNDFINYRNRRILLLDNKNTSKPVILSNITHPFHFTNTFTPFAYRKGSMLISYLNSILTETKFHKAIQIYLRKYKEKNPTNEQFFEIMNNFKPNIISNLTEFFHPYLTKSNFPIIYINYSENNKEIIITQKSVVENNFIWPIYSKYKIGYNKEKAIYFQNNTIIKLNNKLEKEWFLFNVDSKSYLRTLYSTNLFNKLIKQFELNNNNSILNYNKLTIFDDYLYFYHKYYINSTQFKLLMDTLKNNDNIIIWITFYERLHSYIREIFNSNILYFKWIKYLKLLTSNDIEQILNNNNKSVLSIEKMYQYYMIKMNLEIDNEIVHDWVDRNFKIWLNNPNNNNIPNHLLDIILYYGIQYNDRYTYWRKLWLLYLKYSLINPEYALKIKIGLIGTKKVYLIEQILNLYFNNYTHVSAYEKAMEFLKLTSWLKLNMLSQNYLKYWTIKNDDLLNKYIFNYPTKNFNSIELKHYSSFCHLYVGLKNPIYPIKMMKICDKTIVGINKWKSINGIALLNLL